MLGTVFPWIGQHIMLWADELYDCRENNIGRRGWEAVMEGLEPCTRLERLNGIACCGLIAGALSELQVAGNKAEDGFALSFVRYLPRSASTLVTLDLR
jgi:hypothetical protein